MPESSDSPAEIERAYRRARWTILGHTAFLAVCCLLAIVLRRFFKLPPAMLGVVLIVALLVFAGDIMRFFRCRDRLRSLQDPTRSR
jgi:hypothetical protein